MKTEVLIIGGGIAGLTLSLLLGKAGLSVSIIEPRSFPLSASDRHYGRTAALMGESVNVLKTLNLWDNIAANTAPLQTMRIIEDGNPNIDPIQIDFPASDIGLSEFGYNVPNMMLHKMLGDAALNAENITIIEGKLESFDKNIATLENGDTIHANLLVGADGRHSKVRELAGIKTTNKEYNQSAITCLISHSLPHENISTEHHRSGGPFTMVPMPDKDGKHISSIVWVEKTADSDGFMTLDKAAFEHALQTRTRGSLGEVKLANDPENWPLKAIIAKELIAPRLALIAEAAHAMSPIGAQGLNLSLRDVDILAKTIIDAAKLGEDIGNQNTLAHYRRERRLDIETRFYGVDGYNRIVSNNIGFLRGLRRAGLKTIDKIPALKQFAMQQGLNSRTA